MNNLEARKVLKDGSSLPDLCEAVWLVYQDPEASIFDLAEGFKFKGIVEAQTRFAVMKKMDSFSKEDEQALIQKMMQRINDG